MSIRLHDRKLPRKLYFNPDLALGEAYMDGTLTIEDGSLADLAGIVGMNQMNARSETLYGLRHKLSRLLRRWQ
ncbi:MAG: hypothetical protein ACC646_01340 [Paracoccaceae bacterium]